MPALEAKRWLAVGPVGLLLIATAACDPGPGLRDRRDDGTVGARRSSLTGPERRERSAAIRDAAAGAGLDNGLLLAGIAQAETSLAHCWSEATWACEGPNSPSCGGGPVIAGSADGPCSAQQGGLGMFQFDGGTYQQTLARDGERVLTVEGNVEAAVDFVVAMLIRSSYLDEDVQDRDGAIAWLNSVRIDDARYPHWIRTVTAHYNGCVPGQCSVYDQRYAKYDGATRDMRDEFGDDFWYADVQPVVCEPIPATGRVIEEDDRCFSRGGTGRYWHYESAGHGGKLIWTTATADAVDNVGTWRLVFSQGGTYELAVYTDAAFAQSRQATYRIHAAGGDETVTIDQSAANGFQPLGSFDFSAGEDAEVRLEDATGEPLADDRKLVFDALRIGGGGESSPDAGVLTMTGPKSTSAEGGCAVVNAGRPAPASSPSLPLGMAMASLVLIRARPRRLPRRGPGR